MENISLRLSRRAWRKERGKALWAKNHHRQRKKTKRGEKDFTVSGESKQRKDNVNVYVYCINQERETWLQ
jgi:hypothetical protein